MRLNLTDFKTELSILLSIIQRNPVIDVIKNVHLLSKDGVCTLSTSTLVEFGRLTVPCEFDFEALVLPESLKSLDIEIEVGDMILINGISYPKSTENFIAFPEVCETVEISLPKLLALTPLVESDTMRPFTQGINFTNGKAWVSNAHYLIDMDAPAITGILPITKALKLKQGRIGVQGNYFIIESGNLTFAVKKVDGNSPNMSVVIPSSEYKTVTYNREDLKKVITKLEAVYKKVKKEQYKAPPLKFDGGQISCTNINDNTEGSVGIPFKGNVGSFALNAYYLSRILPHCPETVTFKLYGRNKPILIDTDNIVLIMPVNIED